jgi:hypothetical protein
VKNIGDVKRFIAAKPDDAKLAAAYQKIERSMESCSLYRWPRLASIRQHLYQELDRRKKTAASMEAR